MEKLLNLVFNILIYYILIMVSDANEIINLIEKRSYNTLESNEILPFDEVNEKNMEFKSRYICSCCCI